MSEESNAKAHIQVRKKALIVGIQNYEELPELHVTLNDAKLVNNCLHNLGFETTLKLDLTNKDLKNEIENFGDKIVKDGDLVYFYYSGHGGQHQIRNKVDHFLFGVDSARNEEKNLRGVSFSSILNYSFDKKCTYIIILDACREYPIDKYIATKSTGESSSMNNENYELIMPELPARREVEILFACERGKFAIEETEKENGYIARAFSEAVNKVGRWDDVNKFIMEQVREQTKGRQSPLLQSNITQVLYIRQIENSIPEKVPAPQQDSSQISEFNKFLKMLKSCGKCENASIHIEDERDEIQIDLSSPRELIQLKNVRIACTSQTKYLRLDIGENQRLEIENCFLDGIGLRVDQYRGKTSINNSSFCNTLACGIFLQRQKSVQLKQVEFQNCKKSAIGCVGVDNFLGKVLDVKNCSNGFGFYQCKGGELQLQDIKLKNCTSSTIEEQSTPVNKFCIQELKEVETQ